MSQLIIGDKIAQDEWTRVLPPVYGDEPVRKQAGKVVMFKLHKNKLMALKSQRQAKSYCLFLFGWRIKMRLQADWLLVRLVSCYKRMSQLRR